MTCAWLSFDLADHHSDLPVSRALAMFVAVGAHLVEVGEAVLLRDPLAGVAVGADGHLSVLALIRGPVAGSGAACERVNAGAQEGRVEKVSRVGDIPFGTTFLYPSLVQ